MFHSDVARETLHIPHQIFLLVVDRLERVSVAVGLLALRNVVLLRPPSLCLLARLGGGGDVGLVGVVGAARF